MRTQVVNQSLRPSVPGDGYPLRTGDTLAPRGHEGARYTLEAGVLQLAGSKGRPIERRRFLDFQVGAVRVVASLDPDLDLAAMTATKEWLFTPGTRDGKPIPVIVRIEMSFRP